jgi:hypothetical protein
MNTVDPEPTARKELDSLKIDLDVIIEDLAWNSCDFDVRIHALKILYATLGHLEIRLLAEPAYGSQVPGSHGTENRSVLDIHEDSSTGTTRQSAAEVGLCKKSIINLSLKITPHL